MCNDAYILRETFTYYEIRPVLGNEHETNNYTIVVSV
jgi:hypothetical protein